MAVKLHHCTLTWARISAHPCANVRAALDRAGVEYTIVKHPLVGRSRRVELQKLTNQNLLPAIEFEDGTVYREESKDMIARIDAGKLFDPR